MCVSMLDSHSACVFPCWTPTKLVYPRPPCLNILFPCWTPTELVYPCVLMCDSMLDSHRACRPISSCVNVCFHTGLPQSLYILLCECVSMLDYHRICKPVCSSEVSSNLYQT